MPQPIAGLSLAFLIVAAAALSAGPARTQSFDCSQATGADEHAVCTSASLSQLDDQLAAAYAGARRCAPMGMQGILSDSEHKFLADRAACGADEACLTPLYKNQIQYLDEQKKEIGQGAC